MKIKNLIASISLGLVASAGLAASLSASSGVKAASADHSTVIGEKSTIFLQLNTDTWKSGKSKIALYMFNNEVEKSAWGGYVQPDGSTYVEYSYDLDFTPKGCIAFRINKEETRDAGQWCFDNDRSDEAIWATTNDIDFKNVVWLGNYYPDSKWTESGSFDLDAVVKGGASDDWSEATVDVKLTNVKVNLGGNLEVFGSVALPAGTYFKVVKEGEHWFGGFTAYESIAGNLEVSPSGNIHNKEAATYQFYFAYEEPNSIYITDPDLAAADEWAQGFMGADCTATKTGWGTAKAAFESLSSKAQDLIEGEKHIDHEEVAPTFIASAVQRYDYVLELYGVKSELNPTGYEDFLGRVDAGKVVPGSAGAIYGMNYTSNSNSTVIIIVAVSSAAVLAFTLLLVFKKKRHN